MSHAQRAGNKDRLSEAWCNASQLYIKIKLSIKINKIDIFFSTTVVSDKMLDISEIDYAKKNQGLSFQNKLKTYHSLIETHCIGYIVYCKSLYSRAVGDKHIYAEQTRKKNLLCEGLGVCYVLYCYSANKICGKVSKIKSVLLKHFFPPIYVVRVISRH